MPRTAPRTLVVLLVLAATAVLGGCSKADSPTVTPGPSDSAGTTTAGSSTTASAPVATLGGTSGVTTSSAATSPAPTSAASTSAAPGSTPAAPVTVGCAASALAITVQRGSGVAGHQYATVTFKNISTATCPLSGFPGIQLLAAGAPLGTSVRSGAPASTVSLAPGASATSQLVNDSTCGAAISDSVQVIAPNTTTKIALPLAFRGCTVTIDPVRAS